MPASPSLRGQGLSLKAIARTLGLGRKTVRRWLRERADERDRKANRPRVELLELDGNSLDDDPATAPENPDVTVSDADGAAGEGGEGGARP